MPWERGKCLTWDFACTTTTSASNAKDSAKAAGSAAAKMENRKLNKYKDLQDRYIFVPIVIESHGTYGKQSKKVIEKLGQEIAKVSGEQTSLTFLRQSLSITIQKGNAQCVMGSVDTSEKLSEDVLEWIDVL